MDSLNYQQHFDVTNDPFFLTYSLNVSGIYVLEFCFSKANDFCIVKGKLSHLNTFRKNTEFKGEVTAHLPFIGYSKQAFLSSEGQFYLCLETRGGYTFFFDVCGNKFSLSVDLETFTLPKNLIYEQL